MNEFLNPSIGYILIPDVDMELRSYLEIYMFNDYVSKADCTILEFNDSKNGIFIFFADSYDNNEIRKKSLNIIKENKKNGLNNIYIKYFKECSVINLKDDGEEIPCLLSTKNEDINKSNLVYFINTKAFIINETKRYVPIKDKKDLYNGMVLEIKNGDKWIQKTVSDVEKEYESIYKLFIKYEKIRCEYNI